MGKIKGKSIIYKNILLIYSINEILLLQTLRYICMGACRQKIFLILLASLLMEMNKLINEIYL